MSDDLKTLVAQEVAKQLAAISADQTTKKVLEFLNQRISSVEGVVDSWSDGNGNWWRKYADGWIEQGGYVSGNIATSGEAFQVTLPKAFSDANYTALSTSAGDGPTRIAKRYSTHFFLNTYERPTGAATWYACGY